jgi:predicted nucleic acid-binding Zn ribbon protein
MPPRRAPGRPGGVRTPAPPVVLSDPQCPICGGPLQPEGMPPRDGQRACSGRCRAALHRRDRAARLATRDAEVRRLLESALRMLDDRRTP